MSSKRKDYGILMFLINKQRKLLQLKDSSATDCICKANLTMLKVVKEANPPNKLNGLGPTNFGPLLTPYLVFEINYSIIIFFFFFS